MAGKKADDSQMNTTDLIECPICAKSFKQSLINRHVNDCLLNAGIDDSQHVSPIHTRKRKSSYDSPSKKSSSASDFGKPEDSKTAWGSLKPLSPQSNVSTNKKRKLTTTPGPKSNTKQDTLGRSPKSPFSSSNSTVAGTHENAKADVVTAMSPKKKSPKTTPRKTVTKNLGVSTSGTLDFCLEGANPAPISSCEDETKTQTIFTNSNSTSNLPCVEFDFSVPLAEKVRPTTLDEYIGQKQAVGKKSPLCSLLESNEIPSMILWGPPGCGKTTLAKIIAKSCKDKGKYKFTCMSATSAGVNDVKEAVKIAKNDLRMFHRNTIIFLDEIHRFNKLQQDALLPHVEDGTIVLIGATTENPSFQVNSALLSRCKVIVLEKLEVGEVERVLKRALDILGIKVFTKKTNIKNKDGSSVWMEEEAVTTLAGLCDGDARCALNSLQMAIQSQVSTLKSTTAKSNNQGSIGKAENVVIIDKEIIKEGLQRSHILYDRAGEEHYNIISALHKSMRGSDENAALYWLARMLEGGETPLYIARRLVRFASEDIGLADPHALNLAVSTYQACHFLGMPECDVILAQCAVYMARASKSVEVYKAYSKARAFVRNHKGPMPGVPLHLRNAPTKLMKSIGYGKNYKYNPNFQEPVDQEYLPPEFKRVNFFS